MNGPEERFDAPPDPVLEELRDELYSLRTLLSVSLICLVVLTLSVDRYLFKQISIVRQEQHTRQQLVDNFAKLYNFQKATGFWNSLVNYSKTHQDFAVILNNKYAPNVAQTVLNSGNNAKH